MSVLSVQNIGKAFRSYSSEWKRFASWFGLSVTPSEEARVLRHISFDIQPGEAIGIVGQNGAGKSTLLKIITGTLQPSEGKIQVNGRIAAILELGMGFNPELTGRSNVFHTAGLMGYTREQIDNVIDDIEAFADIGEYFDEPVRTYSSGMQVRVAFAVATAYRPEILIIDEALSVGDSYFQHKSFSRIREFQEQGTTLLIVSHDRSAIQALCDRAILLEKGAVIKDGNPEEVFDFYKALIADKKNSVIKQKVIDKEKVATISGTGEATVENIEILNETGESVESVGVGDKIKLLITVKVHSVIEKLILGYAIKDRLGQVVYGTNTWHTQQIIDNPEIESIYEYCIEFPANFGVGSYSIQTALHSKDTHLTNNYEWRDLALIFDVININKANFEGISWNEPTIEINKQ